MRSWLEPLRAALDRAAAPATFFFRDDDAGWDDERLLALLDAFERHDTPLDLAVIPQALGGGLARELCARRRSARLGLHQHGYTHCNNEPEGRKCEFGAARTASEQLGDLARGAERLHALFDAPPDPIFTPPWNRCSPATAACLTELGFSVLSRDRGASPLAGLRLRELPVDIDWCKRLQGKPQAPERLARATADAVQAARGPIGIMLHHAVMDQEDRHALEQLLALLRTHAAGRCVLMQQAAR